MPWYTLIDGVNKPHIPEELSKSVIKGNVEVCRFICDLIVRHCKEKNRTFVLALDGFLGANPEGAAGQIAKLLKGRGLRSEIVNVCTLFKGQDFINKYAKPFMTEDPSFGVVCNKGRLKDLMDPARIIEFRQKIQKIKKAKLSKDIPSVFICYGVGAAIPDLRSLYDSIFYFDLSREFLIRRMEEKKVVPIGGTEPGDIFWKRLYYVDYPILNKHKKYVLKHMDWYVDDNENDQPKLLPGQVYDDLVSTLVKYPLRFKKVFMPGPWGGHKFRDHFNMPELANCAWNIEVSGGDSSLVVDIGIGSYFEIPFHNLYMQYPVEVVGPYCHKKYPGLFPIQVGIDDGYFPEPVSHERRAMPVHLHPDTKYAKKNFNEPLGRYEVYYIVEAYKGANTMHGFYEDADLDEFMKKVIESEQKGITFDWSKYVKCWPSKAGELYLIPAGTAHGTGGNQMVLEMDTCPSITGTEYSFFLYDYRRPTWDDRKKSFSGKLTNLQTKHGIAQCRINRREKWVADNIRPAARVTKSGRGWSKMRFDSYNPMPYHIENLIFDKKIEVNTRGRFFHFLCLTKGEKTLIRSRKHPERQIELEYIQTTVVPACFGEYECINLGKTPCTITRQIWKRG